MALKTKWTKKAKSNFDNIVNYLDLEFGEKTASVFVKKSYAIIEHLQEFPKMGSVAIDSKNIRGFLISKHNLLFYRIKNDELILLNFFDTRKNPSKRNL
jgi:plasmid stabilization system protein ParE